MTIADHTEAVGPVYLAGPITPAAGRTKEQNVEQAVKALKYLTDRRIAVVCPQLTIAIPLLDAVDYEDWMAVDFVLLRACKAVLVLPGWETSKGTRREIAYAGQHEIRVFLPLAGPGASVRQLCAFLGVEARAARPVPVPPSSTT